jgi:hypothetical protein
VALISLYLKLSIQLFSATEALPAILRLRSKPSSLSFSAPTIVVGGLSSEVSHRPGGLVTQVYQNFLFIFSISFGDSRRDHEP